MTPSTKSSTLLFLAMGAITLRTSAMNIPHLPNGQAVRVTERIAGETGILRYQRHEPVDVEPGTCGWIVDSSGTSTERHVYGLGVRFDGHANVVNVSERDFGKLEPVDFTETVPTVERPGVLRNADLDSIINSFLTPLVRVRVMYHTKPYYDREHQHFDSLHEADSIEIERETATVQDVAHMALDSVLRACPGTNASAIIEVERDRYNGCPVSTSVLSDLLSGVHPCDVNFIKIYNRVLRGSDSLPNPGDEPITIYIGYYWYPRD